MSESKRQKQVASLLHEELSLIFNKLGLSMIGNSLISISSVKITPDLLEARIYLSFYQVDDTQAMLKKIEERAWEVKRALVSKISKQLRRMPELQFFIDDTLDYVFKMEHLFDKLHRENPASGDENQQPLAN